VCSQCHVIGVEARVVVITTRAMLRRAWKDFLTVAWFAKRLGDPDEMVVYTIMFSKTTTHGSSREGIVQISKVQIAECSIPLPYVLRLGSGRDPHTGMSSSRSESEGEFLVRP